jgi:hypothetical protein
MTDLLKLASSSSPGTNFGSEHTPLLSPTTKELAQDIGSHVVDFEDFGQGMLDRLAQSAEHVRLWYYPQSDQVMIAQANRIYEVSRRRCCVRGRVDARSVGLMHVVLGLVLIYIGSYPDQRLFRLVGQGQGVSYDPAVPLYRPIPSVAHELGGEMGLVVAKRWERGAGRRVQSVYF